MVGISAVRLFAFGLAMAALSALAAWLYLRVVLEVEQFRPHLRRWLAPSYVTMGLFELAAGYATYRQGDHLFWLDLLLGAGLVAAGLVFALRRESMAGSAAGSRPGRLVMSYDLLIEPAGEEPFERARVDQVVATRPELKRYDAESYRSAGGMELVLTADRPGLPVESIVLRLPYEVLPHGFDIGCDLAFALAEQLGGRVVDTQLGQDLTAESREVSRAKAEEAARWAKLLGTEFEQPAKAYVDEPARVGGAGAGRAERDDRGDGGRPWWKFWERG